MTTGTYERLTRSRAGTAVKTLVRRGAPATAARLQRVIHAARRAWREPPLADLDEAQQLRRLPPRRPRVWPTVAGEVTERLYARLSEADVDQMRKRLAPADIELWRQADDSSRRMLAVNFCVHYGVRGVLETTGLS